MKTVSLPHSPSNSWPFFYCYCIHICTYIYIPKYNLFSLYNITCMYVCFQGCPFGIGQPIGMSFPFFFSQLCSATCRQLSSLCTVDTPEAISLLVLHTLICFCLHSTLVSELSPSPRRALQRSGEGFL